MYKFVKEFKKPTSQTNLNVSNPSLSQSPTSDEVTSRSANYKNINSRDFEIRKENVGRRIASRTSNIIDSPTNRKSQSANDVAQRQPFLKIKSNQSFNHKNGRFFEKGTYFFYNNQILYSLTLS